MEMTKKTSVTEEDVLAMIKTQTFTKLGEKTTVCLTTLTNDFEIVSTSACVDPKNYNAEIGNDIARKRAIDKIWELEGYRLQAAK